MEEDTQEVNNEDLSGMEFAVGGGEMSFYFLNFFMLENFIKSIYYFPRKKIRKVENKATHGETKDTPNFTTEHNFY